MKDKNENIYGKYNHIFRDEINNIFNDRKISFQENFQILSDEGIFGIKLATILIPYFEASNGYAGFDLSVIKYNSYHIIFWYKIMTSELTNDKEKEIACNEITIFFYHWIGAFYSCKEKLLSFIGAKVNKNKIIFKKTCLSEKGQNAIIELFSKYKKLIEIFDIRNRVIHDSYDLEIDRDKYRMRIKHFAFNLISEKTLQHSDYFYNIDDGNISNRYNDMVNLLEEYISIIKTSENICIDYFKNKYTAEDGKFEISL